MPKKPSGTKGQRFFSLVTERTSQKKKKEHWLTESETDVIFRYEHAKPGYKKKKKNSDIPDRFAQRSALECALKSLARVIVFKIFVFNFERKSSFLFHSMSISCFQWRLSWSLHAGKKKHSSPTASYSSENRTEQLPPASLPPASLADLSNSRGF